LAELVLLGLEGQKEIYPLDEKESEGSGELREAGSKEVPVDSVEGAGGPVMMFLEIRSLGEDRM
jgi:hypothetical protein